MRSLVLIVATGMLLSGCVAARIVTAPVKVVAKTGAAVVSTAADALP